MKKSTIWKSLAILTFLAGGITSVFGQNPLTTPSGDLYRQGTNSGNTTGPVASEDPDLVTTGTRVPYLVVPDATLNPTWTPGTDATNTTGINSTFSWTVPAAISTTFTPAASTGHYIVIDVDGAASATIRQIGVQEQSGAACDGSTRNINVRVVAQPTVSAIAVSDGTAPVTSICIDGTNGSLNVPFPTYTVTKTSDAAIPGNATIRVRASLVFTNFTTGTSSNIFTNQILNVDASGNISNADITTASGNTLTDYDSWGTYALTVTAVSDKISRKDINAADGYFAINGGTGYTATYSVLKTPTTGEIYHLPNE